ncbi:MAG: TIGR03936 family radical SAM-associated protein [Oscillospiraceae bacterium]|jgi:radical SAM-linked protein|nr:TIGR03936 family radical SAM-associated protein [Oscillospiraceae bacterium]
MKADMRLRFSKTGRARFMSHLELLEAFRRCFYRCALPLRFSQGFNPHPLLSAAFPLSVGYAGLDEILDFGVEQYAEPSALPGLLTSRLPEGIAVHRAYIPDTPTSSARWGVYEIFVATTLPPQDFLALFGSPLLIETRSKKTARQINALPLVRAYDCESAEGGLLCRLELSVREPALNPMYIMRALDSRAVCAVTRRGFLREDGRPC